MMNKTDTVHVMGLKSNVEAYQRGRKRQWKVVVQSMGLGITLSAFNGMPGVSQDTGKM